MKKTFLQLFVFTLVLMPGFIAMATRCEECNREIGADELPFRYNNVEDYKLRARYHQELKSHIQKIRGKLSRADKKTDDILCNSYLMPGGSGKITEHEIFSKGLLEKSIGEELYCYEPDFSDLAEDLIFTPYGFRVCPSSQKVHFRYLNRREVCGDCMRGIIDFDRSNVSFVAPAKIALSLQFSRILDDSDVVIFFSNQEASYQIATLFLLNFFKVFSNKPAIVGIDGFNEEVSFSEFNPDYMRNHLERNVFSGNNDGRYPQEITDVIMKYGLPVYTSQNYKPQYRDDLLRLLTFIERRCKSVFCFGFQTPISSGRFLAPEYFNHAPEYYYSVLKRICKELNVAIPSRDEILSDQTVLASLSERIKPDLQKTCLYRSEIAQKICNYLTLFRRTGMRIPLILVMKEELLISKDESGMLTPVADTKRIQTIIRERLNDLNLSNVRVTAIGTFPGIPCFFAVERNPELMRLSLDYAMGHTLGSFPF
ncbi:hypothetical protein P0136_08690 [Lentisphaerota bacterium ZTH]|nr:hypothetical protein JYG24_00205 [Lentisphaerota bacterium]WET05440.1 hypothetical protein P0136_08690 [Lentisphaerota bacterium ZTH]